MSEVMACSVPDLFDNGVLALRWSYTQLLSIIIIDNYNNCPINFIDIMGHYHS